jgi:hypothetical protein
VDHRAKITKAALYCANCAPFSRSSLVFGRSTSPSMSISTKLFIFMHLSNFLTVVFIVKVNLKCCFTSLSKSFSEIIVVLF